MLSDAYMYLDAYGRRSYPYNESSEDSEELVFSELSVSNKGCWRPGSSFGNPFVPGKLAVPLSSLMGLLQSAAL